MLVALIVPGVNSGCRQKKTSYDPVATVDPMDASWQPVYIDDNVGTISLTNADLLERVGPTVVSIKTESGTSTESNKGCGVIIDPRGYIVTNNQIVDGAHSLKVTLSDNRTFDAVRWIGDPETDLAIIQIEPKEDISYARFLRGALTSLSTTQQEGDLLAVGCSNNVAESRVSCLGGSIEEPNGVVLYNLIRVEGCETHSCINPSYIGGPLMNRSGQVVGINTIIGDSSIFFAIGTNTAIYVIGSLITRGYASPSWLGVDAHTSTSKYGFYSIECGALVVEVTTGSPAQECGLEANDIISRISDVVVKNDQDLTRAIRSHIPGETLTLVYARKQTEYSVQVTLGECPDTAPDEFI